MAGLEAAGYALIEALQLGRTPFLDGLAHAASFLGDEPFYLVLLAVLYWAVCRATAARLAVFFLLSAWSNAILKGLVEAARPSAERVAVLEVRESGGAPSGHAQNAVVVWGYAASTRPGLPVLLGAAAVVLIVGVSRVYLGAHFPHDVLLGWLIGGVFLFLILRFAVPVERRIANLGIRGGLTLAVAAPLLLLLLHRDGDALPAGSALLGAGLGLVWDRAGIRFSSGGVLLRRALRVAVGLSVALLIWGSFRDVLAPLGMPAELVRYALLGFWITGGAPLVFRWMGLAERDERAAPGEG